MQLDESTRVDYRRMFESHPRPMWIADRETGQLLAINDAGCELFGRTRDALVGAPVPATTREIRTFDLDVDGRPGVMTTAVSSAERRYRLLVEHSADGITVVGPGGIVRYMSPAAEHILGLQPGELIGKHATSLNHPDEPRPPPMTPGEPRGFLRRSRHRDGSWRWIESTATDLRDDPDVGGIIANIRDVTERVESQRAAAETRDRLEYLLSATSAMTYTSRPDDQVTWISGNVEAILGYPPSAFLTDSTMWIRNIHPDDAEVVARAIGQVDATGHVAVQYRFRHADGTYRVMLDDAASSTTSSSARGSTSPSASAPRIYSGAPSRTSAR